MNEFNGQVKDARHPTEALPAGKCSLNLTTP